MNKSYWIKGGAGQHSYSHKCQNVFGVRTAVSWIKNEIIIRHWEWDSQHTSSSYAHFTPHILNPRLYFTLCFRFSLFARGTGVSSPAPPPPTLCFNFILRKKQKKPPNICFPMQHLQVSAREKDKETDISWKSRREQLWRHHFDAQGMSQYTLYDPLWHFCSASATDPHQCCHLLIAIIQTPSPSISPISSPLPIRSVSARFSVCRLHEHHFADRKRGRETP